jgi:small ligand-binding sensory domain FIST
MFITRGREHVLLELDGRPALQVLGELYQILKPADRELFHHSLFLGIAMRGHQQEYHAGDFLIRNLAGILEEQGGLAVGAHLSEGQVVQFHLRDKNTSAHDLDALCRRYQMAHGAEGSPPHGALLFSCLGRGVHLYGEPDHDSKLIIQHLGEVPIGGFFCNGEIGPVHHQTFLHGYTSSIGIFRPRHNKSQ